MEHVDPVCGMKVDPARAAATVHWGDRDWYFCAKSCAEKFRRDPERFSLKVKSEESFEPMTFPAGMGLPSLTLPAASPAPMASPAPAALFTF
ncbi:MAG: YHS domain-containing protein [Acidobacteria bacterium]|nr:YHS domain-containing protein [Acidobacteriota bacterium]